MLYRICRICDIDEKSLRCAYDLLSEGQKAYLEKIIPKKRKQSLAVRSLLMLMLNEYYPDVSINRLEFNEIGKPVLRNSNLHISFTHSGDFVGCAISNNPVGIDIEQIRPVSEKLISRVCTADELDFASKSNDNFFKLWTIKEAYIKATGCGFSEITNTSFVQGDRVTLENGVINTGKIENFLWTVIEFKRC